MTRSLKLLIIVLILKFIKGWMEMVQKKSPFTCVVKGLEQLYQYNYIAEGLLQGTGIDI